MPIPASAVWIAEAVAVAAIVWVCWRLGRRYATIPNRVPLGLRLDGRPRRAASKAALWLGPAAIVVADAACAVQFDVHPPQEYRRVSIVLVFVVLAEVAWLVSWTIDRQVEVARGMTHRIAPMRMFTTLLPLLATVLIIAAIMAGEML